jgi:DNA polymerase III delta subunit
MQKIITNENINIDDESKQFILNVCNNNAKILINYMEKIKLLNEDITIRNAINVCTNISYLLFEEYTLCIKNGELNPAIKILYNLYDKGYSVIDILDNYFLFIKITNCISETEKYDIIPLICKYITVFNNIHEDEIELALFSNNMYNLFFK